jgi:hypothetical protein
MSPRPVLREQLSGVKRRIRLAIEAALKESLRIEGDVKDPAPGDTLNKPSPNPSDTEQNYSLIFLYRDHGTWVPDFFICLVKTEPEPDLSPTYLMNF